MPSSRYSAATGSSRSPSGPASVTSAPSAIAIGAVSDEETAQQRGQSRWARSEEHTSELQSHLNLVCRLLLEKKKNKHDLQPSLNPASRHTLQKTQTRYQGKHKQQVATLDQYETLDQRLTRLRTACPSGRLRV